MKRSPAVKFGVIGLGMAAAPHARSLLDLADRIETVAAFSPTPARRQEFARSYGLPVTGDVETIFADASIDAVLLLTPPNTHLDLVRRAADAGKHILLEKPLETSLARSRQLVEVAETADVKLGVVLQHGFGPVCEALRAMMTSGRLGELVSASARLYNWRPQSYYDQPGRGTKARDGGGVLLTQGIHTLDLMLSLAGHVEEVCGFAATTRVHRMETEDLVCAAARFTSGAIGTIEATTAAYPGFPERIELAGTRGTASLAGTELKVQFHDGSSVEMAPDKTAGGTGADPMAFPHDYHRAVLADFLDAIDEKRPPRASGEEALRVHRLIDALLEAGASGKRVTVERD